MAIRAVKKVDIKGKTIANYKRWRANNLTAVCFDSKFEWTCYTKLKKEKFNFTFHPPQRELVPKFQSLALSSGKGARKLFRSTVRSISYTTDFAVHCDSGVTVFIEAKGFFHPDARIRYKLFQGSLVPGEISVLVMQKNGNRDIEGIIRIIKEELGGSTPGKEVKKKEAIKFDTI
jgi:hypothetical protein